jgi:hypothetical protein
MTEHWYKKFVRKKLGKMSKLSEELSDGDLQQLMITIQDHCQNKTRDEGRKLADCGNSVRVHAESLSLYAPEDERAYFLMIIDQLKALMPEFVEMLTKVSEMEPSELAVI